MRLFQKIKRTFLIILGLLCLLLHSVFAPSTVLFSETQGAPEVPAVYESKTLKFASIVNPKDIDNDACAKYSNIRISSDKNIKTAGNIINSFIFRTNGYCTDADRINAIIHWIEHLFTYDIDHLNVGISDCIVDRKAVCWHYAYLFDSLCKSYGIESEIIVGIANDTSHAWNSAVVNGYVYYFDLTYHDVTGGYIWLSEGEMMKDRMHKE